MLGYQKLSKINKINYLSIIEIFIIKLKNNDTIRKLNGKGPDRKWIA